MPRGSKLKKPSEFRVVYESGRRYDGLLMTAFVLPNVCDRHRLGITASRKVSGSAVRRNRAKRLLRESFRLSAATLQELQKPRDWVLNAKRPLLEVKLAATLDDFQKIIARVTRDEQEEQRGNGQVDS